MKENRLNHLVFHIGAHSELTLLTPEKSLRCYPGDLSVMTASAVAKIAELLEAGVLSTTGQIRQKGHPYVDRIVSVRHLPALQTDEGLLTSTDIRTFQIAKATAASAIQYLLGKAGVKPEEVCVITLDAADGTVDPDKAKRVGILPKGVVFDDAPGGEVSLDLDVLDLSADENVIHAYTDNLFFPKK